MKRILVGTVWFTVLSMLGLAMAATAAGFKASDRRNAVRSGVLPWETPAGDEMMRKNGQMILLAAFILSVVGTATGSLPGTRRPEDLSSDRDLSG